MVRSNLGRMVSKPRHLKNAPIKEALIDIGVVESPTVTVKSLKEHFTNLLSSSYPNVKERRSFLATFGAVEGAPSLSSQERIDGLFFSSLDEKRVIQTRLEGFTANRIKPYGNYEEFKSEAKVKWQQYKDFVKPDRVLRIGLRYINELQIPKQVTSTAQLQEIFDSFKFELLSSGPALEGFSLRMSFGRTDISAKANIHIEIPPLNVQQKVVLFDIDVYRIFAGNPKEEEIWSALDELREWKNEIFFSSLKEEHLKRYE